MSWPWLWEFIQNNLVFIEYISLCYGENIKWKTIGGISIPHNVQ